MSWQTRREVALATLVSSDDRFDFLKWFMETWLLTGGLITQATAASLLGVSSGRVSQMIREGKLNSFQYKNQTRFVSFSEVLKFRSNR